MPVANQLLVGNIGNVYEKRTVGKDNRSVIDFSVVVTPRRKNADTDEWEDGESYWVNCTAWGRLADNIEQSFQKGDQVMLWGRIDMKAAFTGKDGQERPARPYMTVDWAGLEVGRWPAKSTREPRSSGDASSRGNQGTSSQASRTQAPPAQKPTPAPPKDDSLDELDLTFDLGDDDDSSELPF